MKITITGTLGSGKSTMSKMLAEKLGVKRFSVGDFMGELALEKGMSLLELSKLAEKDSDVDTILDNRQVAFGKTHSDFVLDSRLGWHFIPDSFKIWLKCDLNIAAVRIFNDKRLDEKENTSLEKTKQNMIRRVQSERKRYGEYYGVDPYNENQYDLVVDSSDIPPSRVLKKILSELKKRE